MFKRIYFGICALLFIVVIYMAFITFKPIRNVVVANVSPKVGTVTKVEKASGGDINIELANDPHTYYINNALKEGLNPEVISTQILNKEVTLHHINRWTPFTRDGVFPHISKLSVGGTVLFNELKDE